MICWLCISCGWEGGRAEKDGAKIVNGLLMKMEQPVGRAARLICGRC